MICLSNLFEETKQMVMLKDASPGLLDQYLEIFTRKDVTI